MTLTTVAVVFRLLGSKLLANRTLDYVLGGCASGAVQHVVVSHHMDSRRMW